MAVPLLRAAGGTSGTDARPARTPSARTEGPKRKWCKRGANAPSSYCAFVSYTLLERAFIACKVGVTPRLPFREPSVNQPVEVCLVVATALDLPSEGHSTGRTVPGRVAGRAARRRDRRRLAVAR